jgi:hypothetical protein
MTRALLLAMLALLAAGPAEAGILFVTPDTPADLAASTYKASDIARADGAAYALEQALPANARIDALQRMASGDWLISLEAHATLNGATFDPRDVLRTNGAAFIIFFSGAANGIPPGTNVDAVSLEGSDTGPLLISLDVPARVGGIDAEPGDVLRVAGGSWSLVFDASAATPPIPPATNVVGVDKLADRLLLSFDIPTTLGDATYLPGDVVAWDGARFGLYRSGQGNGWGIQHEVAGFSTSVGPGSAAGLTVRRSGALLNLRWDASCSAWADDYGIFAGTLGNWYSHTALDCTDNAHDLAETIAMPGGNRYFLIVPLTAGAEGSYGTNANGVERPRGSATCRAVQAPPTCP